MNTHALPARSTRPAPPIRTARRKPDARSLRDMRGNMRTDMREAMRP